MLGKNQAFYLAKHLFPVSMWHLVATSLVLGLQVDAVCRAVKPTREVGSV
jgi:hypothetical protein